MKILVASAFAVCLSLAAVSASRAMPLAPLDQAASADIIRVAGGCGPGWPGSLWRMPPDVQLPARLAFWSSSAGAASGTGRGSQRFRAKWIPVRVKKTRQEDAREGGNSRPLSFFQCLTLPRSVKQNPARSGVLLRLTIVWRSDRPAATITPAETDRANAAARHNDYRALYHDCTGRNDHGAAIGAASAIGAAMEAKAATAGGIGGAETRERAGNQCCREQVLHVFSLLAAAECGASS